ncbi:T6SS phospholipase effector Tle1-like catalytic domain-containing protein [Rodentibacter myodis]|uniref:T6SS Phospholipase effector Tle1-like catalytic domain-containing protein n=1 Tax=Rodentibacter myodis TaxID=1907939 RepID=A0A1V3JUE9_9PAST|nr:DUF2235 domain-containing protein [Rodentibacter myodis]OOF59931.1 hypothetical protein BKL49_02235 [Rodentibacter myodis]
MASLTCKVIRIGVFFDGTGNNLVNDEKLNQTSNIARLYHLYPKLAEKNAYIIGNKVTECRIYLDSIYIEGVGTENNRSDSTLDKGTGSGGAKRINLVIEQIKALRKKFPQDRYKCYIDVFGFSRGAALARDFINIMNKSEKKQRKLNCIFKFVGLFDTVGSFGKAGDDKNYKPIDASDDSEGGAFWSEIFSTPSSEKYEPYNFNLSRQSAEKIVHFVALDEYRKNFPLTDIEGAGETYHFIGAHSDVGGGYAPITKELIFEYTNKKTLAEAKQALSNPENGIPFGEGWNAQYRSVRQDDSWSENRGQRYAYAYGRRVITNDLQRITLMAMYNCAVKAGVPLLPFTEDFSPSHLANLTKDIAYTEYTPFFNVISSSSECALSLLNEDFSQEFKAYLREVLENPFSVESFINHQTDELRKSDRLPKRAQHFRDKLHLCILAKYVHNSSCTGDADGLKLPPIGFKHRSPEYIGETIANAPLYSGGFGSIDALPIRMVFENNVNEAVVLDE